MPGGWLPFAVRRMWLPGQRHQVSGIQRDHRGAPEGKAEDRAGVQALGSAAE